MKETRHCYQPWNTLNVGADGNVYPCCVSAYDLIIGTLSEATLDEIAMGSKMAAVRRQLLTGNLHGSCAVCHNAGMTAVSDFRRELPHYLAMAAAETGKSDNLVFTGSVDGSRLYAVGNVEQGACRSPTGDEIETYRGFSSTSFLEGDLLLGETFALGLWVKPILPAPKGMVLHYAAFDNGGWKGPALEIMVDEAGGLRAMMSPDGYLHTAAFGPIGIAENAWTHVALRKRGGEASLILNGTLAGSMAVFAGSFDNSNAILRLGVNSAPHRGNAFQGALAGIFIDSSPLSDREINEIIEGEREALVGDGSSN